MRRKRVVTAVVAVPLVSAMLLSVGMRRIAASRAQPLGATADVTIGNFTFQPATLTVAPGTTVTWTNRDDIPHTVVSTDGLFKSKARDTDEKFSFTFDKAGTYPYFCSIHPKMRGQVVVR